MLGAIIGDIIGSRFERHNHKSKDFELFTDQCRFTDDTAMTVAIAKALLECKGDYTDLSNHAIRCMQEIGQKYPNAGYGQIFYLWLHKRAPEPYWSYGNGSAMRVSPVAYVAKSAQECIDLADAVTKVSHDHPEGMKGAEATALVTFGARSSLPKQILRELMQTWYYTLGSPSMKSARLIALMQAARALSLRQSRRFWSLKTLRTLSGLRFPLGATVTRLRPLPEG